MLAPSPKEVLDPPLVIVTQQSPWTTVRQLPPVTDVVGQYEKTFTKEENGIFAERCLGERCHLQRHTGALSVLYRDSLAHRVSNDVLPLRFCLLKIK